MRSQNKSRSRNKNNSNNNNNNRRHMGNVVNRVFDSAGPEGKVRGTPQQIIEKYQSLARDAQLSNDRVAAENFLQHSEHYSRMLGEALSQQAEMRQPGDYNPSDRQSFDQGDDVMGQAAPNTPVQQGGQPQPSGYGSDEYVQPELQPQPEMAALHPVLDDAETGGLIATPENPPTSSRNRRQGQSRSRRGPAPAEASSDEPAAAE
jgi:hypothetical protein